MFGNRKSARFRQAVLAKLPPLLLVCMGLLLSVLASAWTQRTLNESKRLAFVDHASDLVAELRHEVGRHMAHLEGIGSFFRASEQVERDEFRVFVAPLLSRYPSIKAIAWLPRTPDAQVPALVEQAKAAGHDGFMLWEDDESGDRALPARREVHFPVLYVEPEEENAGVPGFDPQAHPLRAQAMLEACRTRHPQATGILPVARHNGEELRFIVFFPVFSSNDQAAPLASPVHGLIAVYFMIPEVVHEILARRPSTRVAIEIADVTDAGEPAQPFTLYMPANTTLASTHAWLTHEERISLAGRVWRVRCFPTNAFLASQHTVVPWAVLLLGLVLTALVSTYFATLRASLQQSNLRMAAETRAKQEFQARLQEREASEAKERLLASIVESTQDAIIGIDNQARFVSWNRGAETIYGYRAEEVLGKPFRILFPGENAGEAAPLLDACLDGDPIRNLETEQVRIDKERIHVSLTLSPIQSKDGHVRGVSLIARDITSLREIETMQRALEQQLQEAQKMESLAVLASGVAHDFNNLLTSILGNADLILAAAPPDSATHREAQEIVRTAERAADLARQMLAYSGKDQVTVEPVQLDELVLEMAQLLEASVSRKVQFSYQFTSDLPPIEADATQVRQVIMNLILNAAEAMGERGGLIILRTEMVPDAVSLVDGSIFEGAVAQTPHIRLEVEDTGPGMDAETAARIFDPFFTTKFSGHGLGLSAVQGIMRAHHGAILVDSHPGQGTRFSLLFPACEPGEAPNAVPSFAAVWRGSGEVLVVEDDPPVRDVTCRLLERFGFSAYPTANAPEAIALLRDGHEALRAVILDYRMPLMTGYEAFLEIRAIRPDLPVLLVTGYSPEEIRGRFHAAMPDAILQKPYSASTLLQALRQILPETGDQVTES